MLVEAQLRIVLLEKTYLRYSIYKLSYECESLFDQLVNHATTINPGLCAEFQQRFAIWASNLGVFVRKSQCLDTRLRSLPDLQDLVARLLDILRRSLLVLAKARSEDPDSMVLAGSEAQNRTNEIQSTAATIDDILNRLNRLGVRIRQSSNTKLGPRLQKFAAGFDLRPFEYLCAFTVHSLYPDTNQSLKDYLWKSMVKRYTTRLFMNSRQEKFKKRREPLASIPEVSSNEIETGVPGNQPMRANNNSIIPGLPKSPTISSQSDLSSYNIDKIRNHAKLPNEASTKRYKTSSVQIDQVNYPRLPIAEPDSTIRTCPWCAKHLNNTLSESDWRQHIDQDFEPYICLSERCSEAHPAFTTFDGWYKHMRLHSRRWHQRFHSASSWVCTVCEANPKAYNSPPALYSHLKRSHGDKFTNEQLEILSRQSKLDKPTAGNSCLLCCFIVEEQDIGDETVLQRRPTREVQQETPKGNILEITNPDTHSPSLSDTSSDSDISDPHQDQSQEQEYPSVAVARHIAAHLQTLMLLTLRFADVHNYNETLGDDIKSDPVEIHNTSEVLERNNLSRLSDVASLSDIIMKDSMENVESTEAPMDIDDYVEDERLIPDTDLDLSDIPRQYDRILPKNDDLLRGFVESGIYQPPHIKYEALILYSYSNSTRYDPF
ncbi:hypothetical protein F4860DRAFT_503923 [Xylaria cubensis]|nr:hypothetical protein F4860DRAFT_503923 [Xylaria cubensis]